MSLRTLAAPVSGHITPSNLLEAYSFFVGSAVPGQNSTYIPHKGVLSPEEGLLYVSYADDSGASKPNFFQCGSIYSVQALMSVPTVQFINTTLPRKIVRVFPIPSNSLAYPRCIGTDISPLSGADLYYGYGM